MRIGGLGAVVLLVWGILMTGRGLVLEALVTLLALSLVLRSWAPVLRLVLPLWLVTWVFLSLFYGPFESLDVSLRVAVLAMSGVSGFYSAGPLGLARFLGALGLPTRAAASVAMVYRLVDYLAGFVWEARDALAGRGLKGRFRILLTMPVPVIVHSFRASIHVAEALYFKPPSSRALKSMGKPVYPGDVLLLAGLTLLFVVFSEIGPLSNIFGLP